MTEGLRAPACQQVPPEATEDEAAWLWPANDQWPQISRPSKPSPCVDAKWLAGHGAHTGSIPQAQQRRDDGESRCEAER